MDRVRDLMTAQPVVVAPNTPLVQCAVQMMDLGIRHLPVVDGGEVVGLVDDGAVFGCGVLVDGALWFRFDSTEAENAGDVVVPVVTVDAESDLPAAIRAMQGSGAAVVTDAGSVVGILSEHDVVRAAPAIVPAFRTIDAVASSPVFTVAPDTSAQAGIVEMRERGVRHLVVAEDGVAMGVVSLRDLVAGWKGPETAVERYMRGSVSTVEAGTTLRAAARVMADEHIGCLPVLDSEGRPVAILTRSDVLDAVAGALDDESLFESGPARGNISAQIRGLRGEQARAALNTLADRLPGFFRRDDELLVRIGHPRAAEIHQQRQSLLAALAALAETDPAEAGWKDRVVEFAEALERQE